MSLVKDRYGSKLSKQQQKPKPPYWRIIAILNKLRLKYREREVGSALYHIIVPDFGIVIKFNPVQPIEEYQDWTIMPVDLDGQEKAENAFGENLMWELISKGYMAYLRSPDNGTSQLYHKLLVREGWSLKIIEMRLKLYEGKACNRFKIEHNKKMRDQSISYILTHYPDFFDSLW